MTGPTPDLPATQASILVIDDSEAVVELLTLLLADMAKVSSASDGTTGLALAIKSQPDLILLDVSLPGIDGFEVCRRLKADPATAGIPVLFVTAGDDEASELAGFDSGAVDFIGKPLRPAIVRARVQTHLALRQQAMQLQVLAQRDGLTGIANRRHLNHQLEQEVARHRRLGSPLSVLILDIDHFKHYNDTLGHVAGDDCLQQVARSLEGAMRRPGELIARYGGEEFVAILPDTNDAQAARSADWIRENLDALALPHPGSPVAPRVTASIGICSGVPGPETSSADFLQHADRALYAAKESGRNLAHALSLP